jgi:hypothetical protein
MPIKNSLETIQIYYTIHYYTGTADPPEPIRAGDLGDNFI